MSDDCEVVHLSRKVGSAFSVLLTSYLHSVNFACFFIVCGLSFTINFYKKILSEIQSVSNSLDPNHGPDLGPNYLQRLSADDKSCN